jgi:SAM-dependent methyltransferase
MGDRLQRALNWLDDLRQDHPVAMVRRLTSALRLALRREPRWVADRRPMDRRFDAQFSVDTGGVTHLSTLRIDSADRREGVNHIAIDPAEMERVLAMLPPSLTELAFVDLGSGKGRAVLLASLQPFRRIIGVEFAPALHEIALANFARFPKERQRCARIELVCGDAAGFDLPPGDTVLFLYNPFGLEVMRKVAARAVDSLRATPRRLYVAYVNPFQAEAWTERGFREVSRRENVALFMRPI